MDRRKRLEVTRRAAVATAIGGMATLGIGVSARRDALAQRTGVSGGGGIAGGGTLRTEDGREIEFSVFASRLEVEAADGSLESVFFGKVQWVDSGWRSQGASFVSTTIASYGPPEGAPDDSLDRELRGTMIVDGGESYPFLLRATDGGGPSLGLDQISLIVDPAATGMAMATTASAEFSYVAAGTLTGGDLQLLSFATPRQG